MIGVETVLLHIEKETAKKRSYYDFFLHEIFFFNKIYKRKTQENQKNLYGTPSFDDFGALYRSIDGTHVFYFYFYAKYIFFKIKREKERKNKK